MCRAWLRAGEQSFKSSLCLKYFPSWTLQHPISLMLHLQTLSLVSSHLPWLWKTACFQETFWLGQSFQHCCSQVQQLFLFQLDSWMGPSMCPSSSPCPHHPISEQLQLVLLTGSCSSLKELCPLSSPQHSPNPAGRGGALPFLVRSSSDRADAPPTLALPIHRAICHPNSSRPSLPLLQKNHQEENWQFQGEHSPSVAPMEPPRVFQLQLSAEAVLVQVQGKGGGSDNKHPMMGIHQVCNNTSHLLSASAKQNFSDHCVL